MRQFKDPNVRIEGVKRIKMSEEMIAALDQAIVSLGIGGTPFPYLDDHRIDGANTQIIDTVTIFVDDGDETSGWLEWADDHWVYWRAADRDDGFPSWCGLAIAA